MAGNTKKTVAVSWRAGFVVMLAKAGSPARAGPETVGVFQTAMAAHTGDEIDIVLGRTGTAEVYHPLEGSSAAMTGVTAGVNIRVVQVGIVETDSPGKALSRRYVVAVFPEGGVTLGALSLFVDGV
jgi:hypothetical protein